MVEWWLPVQRLLASNGVASLVFDYSGYGRSLGRISAAQFEADAAAAFAYLEQLVPGEPVAALGFSLGAGVLAAAWRQMRASRLVLCAGFPSFQEAACRVCVPRRWKQLVPPVWDAAQTMRGCDVPVLVVHTEEDRLFPVAMGRELHAHCGDGAEFLVIPGHSHNEPFNRPRIAYWGPVVRWLAGDALE
jgi:alpha-beta hydrolase superfamily lysophospholipase